MANENKTYPLEQFVEQVDQGFGHECKGIILFSTWKLLQQTLPELSKYLEDTNLQFSFDAARQSWSFANGGTLWLKHLPDRDSYYILHGHRYTFIWRYSKDVWPLSVLSDRLDTLSGSPNRKIRLINC